MKSFRIIDNSSNAYIKKSLVELVGYSRVLIENHLGIEAYSTTEIHVKVSYGVLCITGCNLCIMNLQRDQLIITGSIEMLKNIRRKP